ncbi:MAG: hypothetical protein AAGJ18_01390 [Bacteroidota bacterium]
MEQTFTNNDLVKFIYKETDIFETLEIQNALTEDADLMDQYQALMGGFMELPAVTFAPAPSVLQNILKYSAKTRVEA